jgi:hypothetical protein
MLHQRIGLARQSDEAKSQVSKQVPGVFQGAAHGFPGFGAVHFHDDVDGFTVCFEQLARAEEGGDLENLDIDLQPVGNHLLGCAVLVQRDDGNFHAPGLISHVRIRFVETGQTAEVAVLGEEECAFARSIADGSGNDADSVGQLVVAHMFFQGPACSWARLESGHATLRVGPAGQLQHVDSDVGPDVLAQGPPGESVPAESQPRRSHSLPKSRCTGAGICLPRTSPR